ncbi:MAG: histidinol dehydrogenase [Hyphomonadaceae bacterium]|nr:histidinol dehydrogenase [Hyphomonadaceae bacterium]
MKTLVWAALSAEEKRSALARPAPRRDTRVVDVVRAIFDDVEKRGWSAVRAWSTEFDKHEPKRIELSAGVVDAARACVSQEDLEALDLAVRNVRAFHEATKPLDTSVTLQPGVRCDRVWRAIATCGLYVPGGSAPLLSTLVMLAEPARIAGVAERVAVTPPGRDGNAQPMMIAAAAACGLDGLWLLGGAQAIAALALGCGTPRADKIFGPGNAYVAEAKRYAASLPNGPAIDLPAGPSELMVIADAAADPKLVAADLLSQAEHDADAQVLLVATSAAFVAKAAAEVERQVSTLPRASIAREALAHARAFVVESLAAAADVANAYAPEHLSLQVSEPEGLVPTIENAGAVFMGTGGAEAFGDYVCGPSHVLPTDGAARAWSGVNTAAFMKSFVVQRIDARGAAALGGAARLARLEGLEAHARAVDMRLGSS